MLLGGILVDVNLIGRLSERADYYRNLADSFYSGNSLDEQLSWIEKNFNDLQDIKIEAPPIIESSAQDETLEMYIFNHHVTADDVDQVKHGKYLDKNFLLDKGIKKDSSLANELSAKYFKGRSLTEILKKEWNIEGSFYTMELFADNTNQHTTYYCFVKKEDNMS